MDDHPRGDRDPTHAREGWTELFPFVLFAVAIVATIVTIALT